MTVSPCPLGLLQCWKRVGEESTSDSVCRNHCWKGLYYLTLSLKYETHLYHVWSFTYSHRHSVSGSVSLKLSFLTSDFGRRSFHCFTVDQCHTCSSPGTRNGFRSVCVYECFHTILTMTTGIISLQTRGHKPLTPTPPLRKSWRPLVKNAKTRPFPSGFDRDRSRKDLCYRVGLVLNQSENTLIR